MNLIQIQDQLKSLPNDPRTMQALTAYANGANPAVPPYLALGELNRRKQLIGGAGVALFDGVQDTRDIAHELSVRLLQQPRQVLAECAHRIEGFFVALNLALLAAEAHVPVR